MRLCDTIVFLQTVIQLHCAASTSMTVKLMRLTEPAYAAPGAHQALSQRMTWRAADSYRQEMRKCSSVR